MKAIQNPVQSEDEKNDLNVEKKLRIRWIWIAYYLVAHILSVYGIYLIFTKALWPTIIFEYVLFGMSLVGTTAGAHRLWTHKCYKAKLPLKVLNLLMFTLAVQGSVFLWVRYHRVHHKYTDTDYDPHNSKRGFFYSHMGWTLLHDSPKVINKCRAIDMTDILSDIILQFHHKYYFFWTFVISFVIPAYIPLLWGEDLWTSFIVAVILRNMHVLHVTFLVNSAAHMWGNKPYDKDILPVENKIVSFLTKGEGFHNYHHTFPWDYRAAELGGYLLNISTFYIDVMAKIGWAYDLKTVSEELIEKRVMRSGDGSHPVWGWDDKDLPAEYKQSAKKC